MQQAFHTVVADKQTAETLRYQKDWYYTQFIKGNVIYSSVEEHADGWHVTVNYELPAYPVEGGRISYG